MGRHNLQDSAPQYLHGLQNGLAGLGKDEARLNHRAQLGLRRHIVALQPLHIISELPEGFMFNAAGPRFVGKML